MTKYKARQTAKAFADVTGNPYVIYRIPAGTWLVDSLAWHQANKVGDEEMVQTVRPTKS